MKQFYAIKFTNGRYVTWDDFDIYGKMQVENSCKKIYGTVNKKQCQRRISQLKQEYLVAGLNPPTMKLICKQHQK